MNPAVSMVPQQPLVPGARRSAAPRRRAVARRGRPATRARQDVSRGVEFESVSEGRRAFLILSGLLVAHMLVGMVPRGSLLTLGYALGSVALAAVVVLWRREPEWGLYAAGYIAGAELFWRMSRAGVFHEMGKYAIAFVFLCGLVRQGRLRMPAMPLGYIAMLVPGMIMTLMDFDWATGRRLVSSNVSGPVALAISAAYCSGLRLTRSQLTTFIVAILLPLVTVATHVVLRIATTEIEWVTESNSATSGGTSPNQVSAMLGLGAFTALLCIVMGRGWWRRLMLGALVLWFAGQAALTFSRTGLYLLVLASVVTGLMMVRDSAARMRFLVGGAMVALIGYFVLYPMLDRITEGKLTARYSETHLSNRGDIASADLEIFEDSWLLGTGIGQAKFARAEFGFEGTAAHTEYTRLLAEHGVLGMLAMLLLLGALAANFFRQQNLGRAVTAGFSVWSLAFMAVSAMRLAAPSLLIGVTFARLAVDSGDKGAMGPIPVRRGGPRRPQPSTRRYGRNSHGGRVSALPQTGTQPA